MGVELEEAEGGARVDPRDVQVIVMMAGSETAEAVRDADAVVRAQNMEDEYQRARLRRQGCPCIGSETAQLLWEIEHAGGSGGVMERVGNVGA